MLGFLHDVKHSVEEVKTAASEQTLNLANEKHYRTTLSLERTLRVYGNASNHAPDDIFVSG